LTPIIFHRIEFVKIRAIRVKASGHVLRLLRLLAAKKKLEQEAAEEAEGFSFSWSGRSRLSPFAPVENPSVRHPRLGLEFASPATRHPPHSPVNSFSTGRIFAHR
jgi:hypothetical protein